jgi:predicted metal-dependent hydrolase
MTYPQAYIEFLVHFHGNRDYFECHEILEEYWKMTDRENKQSIWVGFIQLAVSQYHHRRGNFSGAFKTLQKSLQIFLLNQAGVWQLGLDQAALIQQLNDLLQKIEQRQSYMSICLPLRSHGLRKQCLERSRELNMAWGSPSDLSDSALVHRHKERDRTQVIQERNQAIGERQIKETNSEKKE